MRKILLVVSGLLLACNFIVFSQVILTYKTHGLTAGTKNPMKIIEYIEAGNGGQGVIWDFSIIKEKDNFCGEISEASSMAGAATTGADVILKEFNNRFVFSTCDDKLEELGYFYGDNTNAYTRFDEPFIKMKYPFSYGNSYTGRLAGSQYADGKKVSEISGTYEVSADGIGTLILPNGVTYKNALRVKEVKHTAYGASNSNSAFEEVTYRWYLKNYRFPVLVFIRTGSAGGGGCTSFLSAYNPNVSELKSITDLDEGNDIQISVYPNPSNDMVYAKLNLEKESKVMISIYDAAGKYLGTVININSPAGEQTYSLSAKGISLKFGIYFMKISVDGNESVKNFAIQ
jgi:hypothetical protein